MAGTKMAVQKSFSKQYDDWVFIFYPKAWTMPNMAVRHVHPGMARNTFSLDKDGRCTHEKVEMVGKGKRLKMEKRVRCEAKVTQEMKQQAIHDMLGIKDGKVPEWFTETVTFKTANIVTKLAPDWYVRRYNNQYTKGEQRWVFYHDCLRQHGTVAGDTFYKGLFDFLLPMLDRPWACQVCGTTIPTGLRMVSQLLKANIRI